MTKNIRVLLVDDQAVIRQGLRLRLTTESDMTVVGEAGDGPTAIGLTTSLAPDVVILDICMPGMDGFETARCLHSATDAGIVMLSLHDDPAVRARAATVGADIFVAKHEADAQLINAIRRVAIGATAHGQLSEGAP
jgi:DNA-binding NarL/FixJ family response regulator